MTVGVEIEPGSLGERLWEAIQSDEIVPPPLPEAALKVRRLLASDTADASKITAVIHNEPAIATALIRCANSVAYGGLREIGDLQQAVARLGLTRVGSLVTAVQLKGEFKAEHPDKGRILKEIWDHSVATAIFSRVLAIRDDGNAEEAFLAGLLHDTGKLLILKGVDHIQEKEPGLEVTESVLRDLVDSLHCKLGHRTLEHWNLPEPLCDVALRHEEEAQDDGPMLLAYVQAAILLTRKLGMHPDPEPELNLVEEPAIERLGLTDIELVAMLVDLEEEFSEVSNLL